MNVVALVYDLFDQILALANVAITWLTDTSYTIVLDYLFPLVNDIKWDETLLYWFGSIPTPLHLILGGGLTVMLSICLIKFFLDIIN